MNETEQQPETDTLGTSSTSTDDSLEGAPENFTDLSAERTKREPSKQDIRRMQQDIRRMQQFEERIRRTINKNPMMNREQAIQQIQVEEYQAMPLEKKFLHFRKFTEGAFQKIGESLNALRQNDQIISDAIDMNFRAISKALVSLNFSLEDQKKVMEAVMAEVAEEMQAHQEARNQAVKSRQDQAEQQVMEAEAANGGEVPASQDAAPVVPEGATTF